MDITCTCESASVPGTLITIGEIISVDPRSHEGCAHPRLVLVHVEGIPELHGNGSFDRLKQQLESSFWQTVEDQRVTLRNRNWRFLAESISAGALATLEATREIVIPWSTCQAFLAKRVIADSWQDPEQDAYRLITEADL